MKEFKRVMMQPYWIAVVLILMFLNILFFVVSNKTDMVGNRSNYNKIYAEQLEKINALPSSERLTYASDYLLDCKNKLTAVNRVEMQEAVDQSDYDPAFFANDDPIIEQLMKEVNVKNKVLYIQNYNIASDLWSQSDYISGYPHKLLNIQEKASKMKHFNIFNDDDSYEYRNINKTSEDFRKMENQTLTYGNDHLVLSVINDDGVVLCGLILLLITALSFVQGRKYDLGQLVRTYPKGRSHLVAYRIGIMGVVSFAIVLLFYGSRILFSSFFYSMPQQWSRLIQSISAFQDFPIPMTIGTFYFFYGILSFFGFFMMGLLIWVLISASKHMNLTLTLFVLVLGLEYYLYTNVGVSDAYNWSASLNFFNILSMKAVFYHYFNYQIMGFLIGELPLLEIGTIILALLLCAYNFLMSNHTPKTTAKSIPKWIGLLEEKWNLLTTRGGIIIAEHKKLWITSKGLLVIVIYALYLITQYSVPPDTPSDDEIAVRACVSQYIDRVDSELINKISSDKKMLVKTHDSLVELSDPLNGDQIERLSRQIVATDIVLAQAEKLDHSNRNTWLLNYWMYDSLYGKNSEDWRVLQFSIIALVLVLILVPLVAYDNQLIMKSYLRTLPVGRNKLMNVKLRMTCAISGGLWFMFSLREWVYINKYAGGFKGILSNSLSIGIWGGKHPDLPIYIELIILYSTRLFIVIALGLLILLIAQYSSTIIKGILVATLLLTVPVIVGQWPSFFVINRLSFVWWLADVGIIPQFILMFVMPVLIILLIIFNKRSWRRY